MGLQMWLSDTEQITEDRRHTMKLRFWAGQHRLEPAEAGLEHSRNIPGRPSREAFLLW